MLLLLLFYFRFFILLFSIINTFILYILLDKPTFLNVILYNIINLVLNYKINIHGNIDKLNNLNSTIIMSNHYNVNDMIVLKHLNIEYYTIAKSDLLKENKSAPIINNFNYIFFDFFKLISYKRNDKLDGQQVKHKIITLLNNKHNILLFPEGTSTRNGKPKEFKNGIFYLCSELNISVLPITIKYNRDIGLNKEDDFNIFNLFDLTVDIYIHEIQQNNNMKLLKDDVYHTIISKI